MFMHGEGTSLLLVLPWIRLWRMLIFSLIYLITRYDS